MLYYINKLSGDPRRSLSVISFNVNKKQGEKSEMPISNSSKSYNHWKRRQNRIKPFITSTTTEPQSYNTDGFAIKLNRLKEKSGRYNLHRDFLSKCIQENPVLKGLEITLEPTIGNFDQEFIDNWYTNLKQFSIVLMKQIVAYCD